MNNELLPACDLLNVIVHWREQGLQNCNAIHLRTNNYAAQAQIFTSLDEVKE